MNRAVRRVLVLSATGLVASSVLLSGAPASATSSDQLSSTESDPGWYAVAPDTGEVFVPGATDIWANPEPEAGTVSPMLLDEVDWWACHVAGDQGWKIVEHEFWWDGLPKSMSLQCGTGTTHGWFHIRDGHMDQWKSRITQANPSFSTDPWDDLMWFGATGSLDNSYDSSGPVNGKLCVSSRIDMYNSQTNQLVYTFYPTYSWSITNDRLITAYPTTESGC